MSVALATMDSAYGLRLGLGGHHHRPLHHHRHSHHHHNHQQQQQQLSHHHQSKPMRSPSPSSPVLPGESHVVSAAPRQPMIHHRENDHEDRASLRFSVVNILRPDFGKDAILSTRTGVKRPCPSPVRPTAQLPRLNPLPVARDLSLAAATAAATRLTPPQSPASSISSVYPTHHHSRPDRDNLPGHSGNGGSTSPGLPRHSGGLSRSGSLESLASNRSSLTGCSVTGAPSLSSAASTIGCAESVSGESVASSSTSGSSTTGQQNGNGQSLWPAWVYCTRYSDRPSSGPRTRRAKRTSTGDKTAATPEEKRPRTAFSGEQLARLKSEFAENRYLTERRRQQLSRDLGLNEAQIKIWFQNKRAKIKKASGQKNPLALQLMAQGLYNHSTVPVDEDGEEIPEGQTSHME